MSDTFFTDKEILAFVNHECPDANAVSIERHENHYLQLKNAKGRILIVPTWCPVPEQMGIRSVLMAPNNLNDAAWLCNGQNSRGTVTLAFFGEEGNRMLCSFDKWLRVSYPRYEAGQDDYVDRRIADHRASGIGALQSESETIVCGWVTCGEVQRLETLGTLPEYTGRAVADGN